MLIHERAVLERWRFGCSREGLNAQAVTTSEQRCRSATENLGEMKRLTHFNFARGYLPWIKVYAAHVSRSLPSRPCDSVNAYNWSDKNADRS